MESGIAAGRATAPMAGKRHVIGAVEGNQVLIRPVGVLEG
jgi:hypothetical protein